jgi:hypothetical protein
LRSEVRPLIDQSHVILRAYTNFSGRYDNGFASVLLVSDGVVVVINPIDSYRLGLGCHPLTDNT